eukprot:CAMPEP_0204457784 /NCGR_PEP_ID=MMETSP0471-20130131/3033_1 /ASSEMBLY_ACC=CAM_ASM_000602 /TAXON_ID=2969 /ORGANISM="Oxyrrhis marina" /LENGTH=154 /DNA_ID=CAMNT_0051458265 /DNA_START=36 /DNA_END=495 /DNA_ORIENTATION=-
MRTILASTLFGSVLGWTCDGCTTGVAVRYQECAREFGNPCQELNPEGLLTKGQGQKKDQACCMRKEQHDACMSCALKDDSHGTGGTVNGKVNKCYYREADCLAGEQKKEADKEWGKAGGAGSKAAGYGVLGPEVDGDVGFASMAKIWHLAEMGR